MNAQSVAHHTKLVHLTKALLFVLVAVLVCVLLFYPIIRKNTSIRIAFTSTAEKNNTPPPTTMVNANFHGFDASNQPYSITAKTALQVDAENVLLDQVNGDISLNSGVWFTAQANKGNLQIKQEQLFLSGAVELFNDQGYEMHTESMHIDIAKKIAVTEDPVSGQGPLGTLKSHGAVFNGAQSIATFNGPVFVTIYLPPKESSSAGQKGNEE
ncbi:MAG TPA: LPS export ABC transporter periplasmic protein LptC [Rickettsiales bacterium]|nr:LPS export ABC transporter periplasmic protein LptC [Rickettsiales bacterium]